jgi:radical SAM protein with 4Fe4S-binding SPASM domain
MGRIRHSQTAATHIVAFPELLYQEVLIVSQDNQTSEYRHTPFPQQLVIEPTAACNQACIFCGRTYMDRPKKTMTQELFYKIVEEVAEESPYTEVWPTFMGEAMLLGDTIFDWIEYAKEVGCKKITLNTNGTRLNKQNVSRIISSGIDRLIVSCDAHTPETHAIVRPAITESATKGLKGIYEGAHLLIEEIRKQNLERPLIEMQFSMFDENEHEVEDFRKYWIDQGVIAKVRPKLYWSGSVEGGDHRVRLENRVTCLWAMDSAGIHWNGSVVMCPVDCDGKYIAGSVEMQTLKEIWNGALKWTRHLQIEERFGELPEICRQCTDWEVKKAHAYYPDEATQEAFESYINLGRDFMERHFWSEDQERIR